jgi:DNA-binding transcriptional ArsR family regulator
MRRDVFRAISDPNRRAIINLLAQRELTLNQVADNFRISRPAISRHVKILTESGLVVIRREGRERYCAVRLKRLDQVLNWVEQNRKFREDRLDNLEARLDDLHSKEKVRGR